MSGEPIVQLTDRRVDLVRQQVMHADGTTSALTTREAQLLGFLTARPEQDVSRDDLLDQVWEYRANYATRAVDVAMRRLRAKVEPDPSNPVHLISVHGVGYRFVPPPSDAQRFVTPAPPPARTTNLRSDRSAFFGRDRELSRLGELFTNGARLVSVLGLGGIGKTRLALAAARLALQSSDGVWVVDLTEATGIDGVLANVGKTLGVPLVQASEGELIDALGQAMANRGRLFLVLDNFEHVISCAPHTIGRWLTLAPEARFLVTSRERLRVQGEHTIELAPLDDATARELFLDRARAVGADVDPTDHAHLDAIIYKLDHLPLAIELAAPRARVLSLDQLLDRLDRRFKVLATKSPGTGRQTTLRNAIDWSWDLLTEHERSALAQCSVFVGGFSLDGAEAVIELPDDAPWTLDVIEALRDKSLLRVTEPDELPGEVRFGMYDSIREYAAERLGQMSLTDATQDRHASWVLEHATELFKRVRGYGGLANFLQLAVETDNLLAILHRRRTSHPAQCLKATLMLGPVLKTRGPNILYKRLLDDAIAMAIEQNDAAAQARVRIDRAVLFRLQGQPDAACKELGKALPLIPDDDPEAEVEALSVLGTTNSDQGRIDEAEAIIQTALMRAEEHDLLRLRGVLCGQLAAYSIARGRMDDAEARCLEAVRLLGEAGDEVSMATNLSNLGLLYAEEGRVDEARAYIERAKRIHEAWGDVKGKALIYNSLGSLYARLGDLEGTLSCTQKALRLFREVGYLRYAGLAHTNIGATLWAMGDKEAALENLIESINCHQVAGDGVLGALSNAYIGALLASQGDLKGSEKALLRCDEMLQGIHLRQSAGVQLVAWSFLHLAKARATSDLAERAALISRVQETAANAETSPILGIQFIGRLLAEDLRKEPN